MKLCFIGLFICAGCSQVHFDTDLPKTAAIKSFDYDLKGQYELADSMVKLQGEVYYNSNYFKDLHETKDSCILISATLTISDKKLFYNSVISSYYKKSAVDTLSVIKRHKKERIKIKDGYLIFEGELSDTLINFHRKDKIKMHQGNYYLNHFIEKHEWEIYQLEIAMDHGFSINLPNKEDEEVLKGYLIKKNQILANTVHISDDQFNSFVKHGGFRTRFRFKKK